MIAREVKLGLVSLLLIVAQTQLMRFLSLEGITPDILMIWVVYIALTSGQTHGMIWGFATGLMFDLVTGNFIGLSALTKTVCGFVAGYFFNENKTPFTLKSYRFVIIVLVVSLLHNTIYFVIFTQGTDISFIRAVFQFGVATALYTSILTLLPMFRFARKYQG